jgi:L-2-hydroxycarboxylate dehydrogenase (NAD+)
MKKYTFQQLHDFTVGVLMAIGHEKSKAAEAADILVGADLRGIDSHGIARLAGYIRLFEKDRVNQIPI